MFGFSRAKTAVLGDGIHAQEVREDAPKFARKYRVALTEGRTMEITARNRYFGGGRDYSGEVDQPGGRWILFDPLRVADKIIDRDLVPLMERLIAAIVAADKAWSKSNQNRFTDDKGRVWEVAE